MAPISTTSITGLPSRCSGFSFMNESMHRLPDDSASSRSTCATLRCLRDLGAVLLSVPVLLASVCHVYLISS